MMSDTGIFISNLEQYIDKRISYEINDNVIKVYVDHEIYYNYDCSSMKVDMYERNIKTEIGSWNTEKAAKVNFAMLMRSVFNNDKDVTMPYELEKCDSLDKLKLVMEQYVDKKYYSIGNAQIGKVSIVLDNDYEILYMTDNKKYRIDQDADEKYIFGRFYYEVIYFASFIKNLKDYEIVFNEIFSDAEIVNLIGY